MNLTTENPSTWTEDGLTSLRLAADTATMLSHHVTTRRPRVDAILEYKVYHWLSLYFVPVLVIGGGISNLMAIVVLRSVHFRGSGTAFLLTCLALTDITVLLNNAVVQWTVHLPNPVDLRTLSDVGCRIQKWVNFFSPQWSAWTLVLVTAERAASVWWPFKAKILFTRKRLVLAWGLFTAGLLGLNSPILFKTALIRGNCRPTDRLYMSTVVHWLMMTMMNALPSLCICIFNIAIIIRLMRPEINRQNGHNQKANKQVTSLTLMLFSVSAFFLLSTTTTMTFFVGRSSFFRGSDKDAYLKAREMLTYGTVTLIYNINNSINFLLYCVSGARFRRAMAEMFCGRCRPKGATARKSSASERVLKNTGTTGVYSPHPSDQNHLRF